jgi:hypothetical protein
MVGLLKSPLYGAPEGGASSRNEKATGRPLFREEGGGFRKSEEEIPDCFLSLLIIGDLDARNGSMGYR